MNRSNSLRILYGILSLTTFGSIYCIALTFKIYVDNQLSGRVYSQPLNVVVDRFGGPATHQIVPDQTFEIATSDYLKNDSSITFKGTDDVLGYWIRETSIAKSDLIEKWKELGQQGPLTIKVTAVAWTFPYELAFTYSNQVPENMKTVEKLEELNFSNPFTNFPAINYNGLQNVISAEEFLKLRPSDWNKILSPAGYIYNQITAEDFSRSILGVPVKYDEVSIISAKDLLLAQWKAGKEEFKTQKFIKLMRDIILQAKDILERANAEHQTESPESGWVSLEADEESSSS